MNAHQRRLLSVVLVVCIDPFSHAQETQSKSDSEAKPARLTFYLPADAELEVEGKKVDGPGEVRHLESSPLPARKRSVLKLKATWTDDGKPRTINKRLTVEAGQAREVDFHLEDLSSDERKVLELTNQEREKADLAPFKVHVKLTRAARGHSANMARQGMLAHTLDDKGPAHRIAETGYRFLHYGENVAEGSRTPAEVVRLWMNSPGHRENILEPRLTQIGIGLSMDQKGRKFWTQVFATPAGKQGAEPK
ncbi:MAG: TIGR03000 domain-containing protein [Planctomycetes bacterium]|nr:TIGR03000 domain-containing protein [Planctomycetota bacterium]